MSQPLSGRDIECYPCPSFHNSEIKQLSPLFFAMLWDIDLIFGMWVYNYKLQIKYTFRSGPMIFGRVMALGLRNLVKYLVVTTFFRYVGDIDLIFDIWVYNDELQIKFLNSFRLNDFWPTYSHWYRTSYSYTSVVDSWSYQDLFR
jgi:hypothetical protein